MKLGKAISVRFSEETSACLKEIADESNLTATDLIRLAVKEYVSQIRERGHVSIPIKINQVIGAVTGKGDIHMDNRKGTATRAAKPRRGRD